MKKIISYRTRMSFSGLLLGLISIFAATEASAQFAPPDRKTISFGIRSGVSLTNYAKPLDKVRTNVAKPVAGIYVERPVTQRIIGQFGLAYTPYTIKWPLYSSSSTGVSRISYNHLHYLQADLRGLYRLQYISKLKMPVFISGGAFLSRLLDATNTDYYPKQNESFSLNIREFSNLWNAGLSLGALLERTFLENHTFRLGAEWSRGMVGVHSKRISAFKMSKPQTRAYSLVLSYHFDIK